jgi:hypothetical protein
VTPLKDTEFTFELSTFLDQDDLEFTLYYKTETQNLEWDLIENSGWITFEAVTRKISFNIPIDFYRKKVSLKIVASDGYSENEDEFSMVASGIPVAYIIE